MRKSPRLHFLDAGLVNNELGIQSELLLFKDLSNSYKGAVIPHMITQELISLNSLTNKKPNLWKELNIAQQSGNGTMGFGLTRKQKQFKMPSSSTATTSVFSSTNWIKQRMRRKVRPFLIILK